MHEAAVTALSMGTQPAPGRSQPQQPVQHSWVGARNLDYLCPACCPRDQCYRVTADAKRPGHRRQGGGGGLTIYRTGGDPGDQYAIVLAADASTG